MKRLIFISVFLALTSFAFAKKVRFSVDMSGIVKSPLGMHISGDFQTIAGFAGGDWMPNTTPLAQVAGDTNIYTIVVDIPAFRKYEYKFVNGDQFYEAEFVPIESRVGYNFNDNRWIYVDSLANDTSFVGAIRFSQNAPMGYHLLRLKVDLRNEPLFDPAGAHVGGSFQGWNTTKSILYSLNDTIHELIVYIDTLVTSAQFRYINGNSVSGYETVPGTCSTAGNRDFAIPKDTVLAVVCFSNCSECIGVSISEMSATENIKIYPNPTSDFATLSFEDSKTKNISITNVLGKTVRLYSNINENSLRIDKNELSNGIYFISIRNNENKISTTKLIIQ